jgi:argininosuccinate lyase
MTKQDDTAAHPPGGGMDLNAAFRGGGRSVEFLDRINKASLVMLRETGLVPPALAAQIARGIAALIAEDEVAPPRVSADYLDYEPRLIAVAGPEASRLHTGRSRQDIAGTIARMNLRDGLLRELEALIDARAALLALAARHVETIIPAYTHGVQAQPTTFGHYLLAFASALARQAERMREAYTRINLSPLGSAALATSSFALDRARLAALLGFDRLIENAYDANHLAPVDSWLDLAGALAIAAVEIGQLAQDLHAQYAEPAPWILLASGRLTGTSSIMPQKRNPAALEQLRVQSTLLLGDMQAAFLVAHNVRTGMFDYRTYDPIPCARALQVLALLRQVIEGIVIDKERALAEVRADYSTTTEIADALLQRAEVPFRLGHHFASALTDYGRTRGVTLDAIPFAEARRLYQEQSGQALPLTESEFAQIISAEHMIQGRRGRGGPQRAEVERMLADESRRCDADRAWLYRKRGQLVEADVALERAFQALAD